MSNPDLRKCQILQSIQPYLCVLHLLSIVPVHKIAIGTPNGNPHYLQILVCCVKILKKWFEIFQELLTIV